MREPEPAQSEEGIADIIHWFQLGLPNFPSELAFDDDCRAAVFELNNLRLMRVENLGDGYDVSDILCYDFD